MEQKFDLLLEFLAGDLPLDENIKKQIDEVVSKTEDCYSRFIYSLTYKKFNEEEAKKLWEEILKHKYEMSMKLGRNVGIRVATMDYFENIKGYFEKPVIIDAPEVLKALKLATVDPLTGLYNRAYFFDRVREEIMKKNIFCICMLDLDGFKEYNDKQGHQAGDLLLQEFANILLEELTNKVVARYGGDEFIALFSNQATESVKQEIKDLLFTVKNLFSAFNITLSGGIAEYPTDGNNISDLIRIADESLYRAKEFGGNLVLHFKSVKIKYIPRDNEKIKTISCVGDFNHWNKNLNIMRCNETDGSWYTELRLKPGRYRYKFLVNGTQWIPDPDNQETANDGFGGLCSVLKVET